MNENLLTTIATTIGTRRAEDIASGALAYLLERYPPARTAFLTHLQTLAGFELPADLRFRSQVAVDGLGRTDISGVRGGIEEVIIEAKIAAGLHGDQIATYLQRLRGCARPLLVVLAPSDRLRYVWHAVCSEAGALSAEVTAVAGSVTLAQTTWEDVINALEGALIDDADGAAELRQIAGLYRHIETSAFLPFSDDDLSNASARTHGSITRLIVQVLGEFGAGRDPDVEFTSNMGAGTWGFGRGGSIGGLNVWCGFWPPRWTDVAPTPMWLQFKGLGPIASQHLVAVIEAASSPQDVRLHAKYRAAEVDVVAPLYFPTGVDEAEAVRFLVERLQEVGRAIRDADLGTEQLVEAVAEAEAEPTSGESDR